MPGSGTSSARSWLGPADDFRVPPAGAPGWVRADHECGPRIHEFWGNFRLDNIDHVIPVSNPRYEHWLAVNAFVAAWYSPLTALDGLSIMELERAERQRACPIPAALGEWYQLAGKRKDLAYFGPPEGLVLQKDTLIFHCDDDCGDAMWGIHHTDLTLLDPFVLIDAGDHRDPAKGQPLWIQINQSLSVSIFQIVVMDTINCWEGGSFGLAHGEESNVQLIMEHFVPFGFPDARWLGYPTLLFHRPGCLVAAVADSEFYALTHTEADLLAIGDLLKLEWETL